MIIHCKRCCSSDLRKNGFINGKQRFHCKSCGYNSRAGDNRVKYSLEKRLKVLRMYLEGIGIMSIERLESVPNPLIIYWLRQYANIVREKLSDIDTPEDMRHIDIVEIDELFSYVQKKLKKSMSGLPLTETGIK